MIGRKWFSPLAVDYPCVDFSCRFPGGKLLQDLPRLWDQATVAEQRDLLLAMMDAVYVDHKEANAVVAIQPKPAFRAVFQVATTRADSGVVLIKEPPDASQKALSPCSWWRRGRVGCSQFEHFGSPLTWNACHGPRLM